MTSSETILQERAARLALPPVVDTQVTDALTIVTFELAGDRYALEARHVREVALAPDVTPVPAAPAVLVGVMNLRGEVLAVLDPRPLLGMSPHNTVAVRPTILILGTGQAECGLLVDHAFEVTALPRTDLHPPPVSHSGLVRAITTTGLALLDGSALLADPRFTIDQSDDGEVA
jgi:purine-binding chemotaxis protein CheW